MLESYYVLSYGEVSMKELKGFLIILGCLFIGNILSELLAISIPGSILGMILLLILLITHIVKLDQVEKTSSFLLSIMLVMFIPGAVNLMNVIQKFENVIFQVVFIVIVSTVIILIVTSLSIDKLLEKGGNKNE